MHDSSWDQRSCPVSLQILRLGIRRPDNLGSGGAAGLPGALINMLHDAVGIRTYGNTQLPSGQVVGSPCVQLLPVFLPEFPILSTTVTVHSTPYVICPSLC